MVAGGFHKMLHDKKVSYDGSCASAARPIIVSACDYMAANHSASCNRPSPAKRV